jgi:tetraacyldisaccharide 4'-kinase
VVASPDRVAGAALLESLGVELILSVDGLQHYALGRELEVAVIDGDRGLGNGRLLPAGPLRESAERLSRTDFVVVNAASGTLPAALPWRGRRGTFCMRLEVADAIRLGGLEGARPLGGFVDDPVHGVAAIGHPERFFRMLREAGLRVIEHPFPDHHAFVAADLEFADSNAILMTSKDAVKCRQFANSRMWEVPVHASLAPEGGVLLVERVAALARKTTLTE